jgi:hypothetical protein
VWQTSHRKHQHASVKKICGKNFFTFGMILVNESDSGEPYIDLGLGSTATTTAWGNVMDFDRQHWLDYDIIALVVLVLAITLLELTVLGILGLTSPQLWWPR